MGRNNAAPVAAIDFTIALDAAGLTKSVVAAHPERFAVWIVRASLSARTAKVRVSKALTKATMGPACRLIQKRHTRYLWMKAQEGQPAEQKCETQQ